MRSFHGQLSDNQPIRRNHAEKEKQLRDLKETLAAMKPQTSPALKDSIQKRIRELSAELRSAERDRAARTTNREQAEARPRRPRQETIRSM